MSTARFAINLEATVYSEDEDNEPLLLGNRQILDTFEVNSIILLDPSDPASRDACKDALYFLLTPMIVEMRQKLEEL